MRIALSLPEGEGPHPVIVLLSLCGARWEFQREDFSPTIGRAPEFCSRPPEAPASPPNGPDEDYLRGAPAAAAAIDGFALVVVFAGDVVPDNEADARAALALFARADDPGAETGAIAAWAWSASRVLDYIATDPRLDAGNIGLIGHSRMGKTALLAAAFDARIKAVIAHQSGTGGATLSRHEIGETVAQITERYFYWFAPRYATYAGNEAALPIDQHQLLGLIAPRGILLGNGTEDEWADPDGAWRSAFAATPVYHVFGATGLSEETRDWPMSGGDLLYFLRPGRHGFTRGDWERFFDFMSVHFEHARPPVPDDF